MTVRELMLRMTRAYVRFDADAVAAWQSVFVRKLGRYEGPELAEAADEVMSSFRPKAAQPYPIPADFEAVLPTPARLAAGGPAIDFKGHARRKAELLEEWRQAQWGEIVEWWGSRVAMRAEWLMRDRAHVAAWQERPERLALKEADLQQCLDCTMSSDRVRVHGRIRDELWPEQMTKIRSVVLDGRYPDDSDRPA